MGGGAMIQAIETRYRGYRFRSRLEARWAVFFDALGVKWEYEKEGYMLPSGPYLPDFWLPQQQCWVEIKGTPPTKQEMQFASDLCSGTKAAVFIFDGSLFLPAGNYCPCGPSAQVFFGGQDDDGPCWDDGYTWCICNKCGSAGIEFNGRSDRLPCKECYPCALRRVDGPSANPDPYFHPAENHCVGKCQRTSGNLDKGYSDGHPRIVAAYAAALAARFEHGESGAA